MGAAFCPGRWLKGLVTTVRCGGEGGQNAVSFGAASRPVDGHYTLFLASLVLFSLLPDIVAVASAVVRVCVRAGSGICARVWRAALPEVAAASGPQGGSWWQLARTFHPLEADWLPAPLSWLPI